MYTSPVGSRAAKSFSTFWVFQVSFEQINLANYCGGEKILSPLRFQHCGGERPHCTRGSDAFVGRSVASDDDIVVVVFVVVLRW